MGNNGSLGAVYAGRFVAGLGIGQTVVVAPVYLAEIAPASIRGLCTCMFTGFVYLGTSSCEVCSTCSQSYEWH